MYKSLSVNVNNLSVIHSNIRSVPKNLFIFVPFMSGLSANFNVICLTETWLTLSNFNLFGIDGYNYDDNCRPDRVGGGTSIFMKEYIPYYHRVDLDVNKE